MIEKVLAYADRKRLFRKGDRVIAAVSGGADSTALLEILLRLKERYGYELAALHVNHGLRRVTADRDEQFVKEFCAERNIPCLTYKVEVRPYAKKNRLSLEEAARILRYQAMEDAAEVTGATAIAVAHHMNDQAETVLFQMIRGSGLRGLSGMAPVRDASREYQFKNKKVRVIRPLLCVEKTELTEFLRAEGLSWCEDETNASDDATRNRIRHRVLPALSDIRPDAAEKIAGTAEYLSEVDAYLRHEAAEWLEDHRVGSYEKHPGVLEIEAGPFGKLAPVLREYVVLELLRDLRVSMKDVGRAQIDAAAGLAEKQVGKKIFLTNGVRAERTYETVKLSLQRAGEEPEQSPGAILTTRVFPAEDPADFPKNDWTKWFDCDRIKAPVELRTRREGDRFSPVAGGHKKLKDVLIDLKIPREERDHVPLLASGEDILWIVGYRMSEEFKVTPTTRRILEASVGRAGAEAAEGKKEDE